MIRPFDWRDFNLVRRLAERGVCFDSEVALTRGAHPLQSAVLSFLAPGVSSPTFVLRKDDDRQCVGFGQIRLRNGDAHARLIFLAPSYSEDIEWEKLLERLIAEAASRGAHNLIAEVDEHGTEFEAMRKMGFAIYTRQTIWKRASSHRPDSATLRPLLRPQQSSDSINIQTLYTNVTPRLIQQVEPPPAHFGHGFVFEENGEITAFFDVSRGPLGIWIQPYLHPSSFDYSAELLSDLMSRFADRESVPVYVCARSHQDWLRAPLTDLTFETFGDQAVMVKRLAVRIGEPEFKPIPVIPGTRVTTHMIKSDVDIASASWKINAKTNHG
jgi:hypothetical protein